ncbi:MAG: replicative DNA helicase [Deltaproteobacteria bacterium]|nr:replicative DNA helicase [Deltaproteobacteria bacterium]
MARTPDRERSPRKVDAREVLGRVPPHAEDAEKALLGAILVDDKALPLVQDLCTTEDFYVEAHRAIFEAMVDLSGRGVTIDAVTLAETLKQRGQFDRIGGAAYLDQLIDVVPISAHVEEHASLIREKAIVRRLILACSQVVTNAFEDYGDLDSFLDGSEQNIFEISRQRHRTETAHIRRTVKQVFTELDALSQSSREVIGVPTGFARLDSITAGLQPSDLIIIAGRPSVGKTSFVLNLLTNAAGAGKTPVALFSLEMSNPQIVRRILASEAGIPAGKLRTAHGLTQDDWTRLFMAADRVNKFEMYLDDSPMLTVAQLRGKVRRLKLQHGIGAVAVDYLQLMRPVRSYDSREREIAEISRNLKALAKELEIPVLALSQLSRDVEKRQDKRPVLADLRESGAIEQDADIVMFLHDPNPTQVDRTHRQVELIVAKHRAGPTGAVPLVFSGEYTRFSSATDAAGDGGETAGFAPPDDGAF